MARHSEGWRLRKEKGRETYLVRFRVAGERIERSTGTSDPREASKAAERIYSDAVQRSPVKRRVVRRGDAEPLEDLISTWLAGDTTLDPDTAKVWETYGRHWLAHWETLADVTDVTCSDYRNARLRRVQGVTVRKELGALRRFLAWCHDRGHLPRVVTVPGVPAKTTGKRFGVRRRVAAPDLSPDQVEAFLAALPEWSTSKKVARFPIRARFVVQYETGLRPSTIDGLEVPAHWRKGTAVLVLTDEVDKIRWGRELPLTPRAVAALTSVCPPKGGLLFGGHDYREHVRAAARATLPPAVAAVFTGAHTRSARATHLLERTGNIAGVQHLLGHKDTRSTSRYLRPSFRAAEAVLESFGGHSPNTGGTRRKPRKVKTPKT
jgi:integrase